MINCTFLDDHGTCMNLCDDLHGKQCIEINNLLKNEQTYCGYKVEFKNDRAKSPTNTDAVNHPNHYCQGGIECIKAIEASMTPEEFQGYCKGNVMKYIWRFREKNGLEDLKKAQVYLGWMIESKEKQEKTK